MPSVEYAKTDFIVFLSLKMYQQYCTEQFHKHNLYSVIILIFSQCNYNVVIVAKYQTHVNKKYAVTLFFLFLINVKQI